MAGAAGAQAVVACATQKGRCRMLYWAVVFLAIALVAAALGFGVVTSGAAVVAKVLFFVFMGLFVVSLAAGMFRAQWGRA